MANAAKDYIAQEAKSINLRLWMMSKTQARYEELVKTPGEHHLRRKIAECLSEEKTVTLYLLKEEKSFVGKINAKTLCNWNSSYYSSYSLEAPDRRAFEKTFGRNAEIRVGDIQKITYGKKVLYEQN